MSLKTRTITGLSFGAIMISATVYSQFSCSILFTLINILCVFEFSNHILSDKSSSFDKSRRLLLILIGSIIPVFYCLSIYQYIDFEYFIKLFSLFIFILFIFELFAKSERPFTNIGSILLTVLYLSIPFSLVIDIIFMEKDHIEDKGNLIVLFILFMVWASDVFAYLLGSKIGKTKLFPRISPNKTWEGTISGFIGSIIVGIICFYTEIFDFSISFWILFAALCSIFGILGDLIESMFKRSLNIKDSGNILPGHGGFLDRFDAFIFVVPFIWTYLDFIL